METFDGTSSPATARSSAPSSWSRDFDEARAVLRLGRLRTRYLKRVLLQKLRGTGRCSTTWVGGDVASRTPAGSSTRYLATGAVPLWRGRGCARTCAAAPGTAAHYDEGVAVLRAPGRGEPGQGSWSASCAARPRSRPGPERARPGVRAGVFVLSGAALLAVLALVLARPGAVATVGGPRGPPGGQRPLAAGATVPAGGLVVAAEETPCSPSSAKDVLLRQGAALRIERGGTRVALDAGRARFAVTHAGGVPNPFEVVAGDTQVFVQGTIFVVEQRERGDVLVAVKEGRVRVAARRNQFELHELQETTVRQGAAEAPRAASASSLAEDLTGLFERIERGVKRALKGLDARDH